MAENRFFWSGPPSEKFEGRLPRVDVVIPLPSLPVKGIIMCRSIVGTYLHWTGERTAPCMGDAQDCEGCRRDHPRRWKGYLAITKVPSGMVCLAQLTAEAVASDICLSDPKCNLIGLTLEVARCGKSKTSRLVAKVSGPSHPTMELTEDGIKRALIRLWAGKGRRA